MLLWHNFSLSLGSDFFHEVDHSTKHGLALFKSLSLLLSANKDELGVFLTSAALHLNECLDSQQLV